MKNNVATQFAPIMGSKSFAVRSPISTLFAPVPALFQSMCNLGSRAAKLAAERLTAARSLRSSWRNFTMLGVFGAGDISLRAAMAFSAFSWSSLSVRLERVRVKIIYK